MALRTTAAFFAGVASGWVARSALGSSREAVVTVVVAAHRGRERVKRVVAQNAEWLDDLFAEGRARYDASRDMPAVDHDTPPHVAAETASSASERAA